MLVGLLRPATRRSTILLDQALQPGIVIDAAISAEDALMLTQHAAGIAASAACFGGCDSAACGATAGGERYRRERPVRAVRRQPRQAELLAIPQ